MLKRTLWIQFNQEMGRTVISVENVSKQYHLGMVGASTFGKDIKRRWNRLLGKEDTALRLAEENDRTRKSESEIIWALQNISFDVKEGEVLGVIGRNGAGKSTILKILSRITSPTSGELKVKGRIASLLEVGTGFHPDLTGRENIFLNGAILGMKRDEIRAKFDEIVDFSGVERFIDTPVKRYSSGMFVRLAFAVAAHLETEILILDEVLAVGDVEFQKKCLGKMNYVSSNSGRTVLFVSHQMEAIQAICNRAILLQNGKLAMNGETKAVVSKYLADTLMRTESADLMTMEDRKGSGEYRYAEIYLTDGLGNRIAAATPGTPINIHLKIKKMLPDALPIDALCSMGFHDEKGKRLFTLSSSLILKQVKIASDTEIVWRIDNLQLYEGSYRCNVFLAHGSTSGIVDWIQDAFLFKVNPNDYFGTGQVVRNGQDLFFVNHHLTLKPLDV